MHSNNTYITSHAHINFRSPAALAGHRRRRRRGPGRGLAAPGRAPAARGRAWPRPRRLTVVRPAREGDREGGRGRGREREGEFSDLKFGDEKGIKRGIKSTPLISHLTPHLLPSPQSSES